MEVNVNELSGSALVVGERYNWKHQSERLVYKGKAGCWHQFAKVESPWKVWCEVLDSDLRMLERTNSDELL